MKNYIKQTLTASLEKNLPEKAFLLNKDQVEHLKNAGQIVLALVAVAGVVAVATIAPNALRLFKSIPALRKSLRKSNRPAERIARAFYYLKRRNYVRLLLKDGAIVVEVTQAGKKRLLEMNLENLNIPISQQWDGKWWFVLADIPTKDHRNQADSLRRKIRSLGLYPLQRTVWVYPFNPIDQIAFVCGHLQIDRFVTVLRADKIEDCDEKVLKEHFKRLKII
ncbi:MAG: hypothetical protein AAB729_02985 [Patescibacteria group bacterium]